MNVNTAEGDEGPLLNQGEEGIELEVVEGANKPALEESEGERGEELFERRKSPRDAQRDDDGNDDAMEEGEVEYQMDAVAGADTTGWARVKSNLNWLAARIVPPGTVGSSIFELLGATLGAGCLSLPSAIKDAGILGGLVFLILGMLAAFYSLHLLVEVSEKKRIYSYEELTQKVMGKKVGFILELSILLFTYGTIVAYMMVIGDTLPPFIRLILFGTQDTPTSTFASVLTSRAFIMTFFVTIVVFPLSMLRNISSLRYTSLLGFLSITYLVLMITLRSLQRIYSPSDGDSASSGTTRGEDSGADHVVWLEMGSNLFLSAPIILYGFSNHVNIFAIRRELRNPTLARTDQVIGGTNAIVFVLFLLVGMFGYLQFREKTDGNILNNYPTSDIAMQTGALAITLTVVLNIPLSTHPGRHTLDWMLFGPSSRTPELRYFMEIFCMVYAALALSIFVPGIDLLFAILGSTATAICCYIMPAVLYLKVSEFRWLSARTFLPALLAVGSSVVGLIGTAVSAKEIIQAWL